MMFKGALRGCLDALRMSPGVFLILCIVNGLHVNEHYESEGCEVTWFNSNDARRTETEGLLAGALFAAALAAHTFSSDPIETPSSSNGFGQRLYDLTLGYILNGEVFGSFFTMVAVGCASAALWFTLNGALTGACINTTDLTLVGRVDNISTYAWMVATLVFLLSIVNAGFTIVLDKDKDTFRWKRRSNTLLSVASSIVQFMFALYIVIMMDSSDFLPNYVNNNVYESASCTLATSNGVFDSGPSKQFRDTLSLASIDVSLGVVKATTSDKMYNFAAFFLAIASFDLLLVLVSWVQFWYESWTGQMKQTTFVGHVLEKIAIPKALVSLCAGICAGVFIATFILENAVAGCPMFNSKFENVDALYNILTTYVSLSLAEAAWNAAFHDRHAYKEGIKLFDPNYGDT